MAIKCGIVGLPNVGKSTLFNAMTAAEIAAENYPFCTIEPNVGVVPVPVLSLPSAPVCTMACADTDYCCCAGSSSAKHEKEHAGEHSSSTVPSLESPAGCPDGCATVTSGVRIPLAPGLFTCPMLPLARLPAAYNPK